jgi:polyhydroxyalkanoate synthesis regulator phasin
MSQPKAKSPAKRRSLNPVDAVVVTRERLQEIVDDAVRRGRMTRSDAADLVTEILSRGRNATEEFTDRARREVDRARRATGIGPAFPITNYESLTAAQVQSRLGELSNAELRKVRDYERRNANRKTVLSAIETQLGS